MGKVRGDPGDCLIALLVDFLFFYFWKKICVNCNRGLLGCSVWQGARQGGGTGYPGGTQQGTVLMALVSLGWAKAPVGAPKAP